MPLKEVHGHPPDLSNLYHQGSVASEHAFVDLKAHIVIYEACQSILNEGVSMHPESWPSAGGKIKDLDTSTRASVPLKGEQKHVLPYKGSEHISKIKLILFHLLHLIP